MRTTITAGLGTMAMLAAVAALEAAENHRQQRRLDVLHHDILDLLRDITTPRNDRHMRPIR